MTDILMQYELGLKRLLRELGEHDPRYIEALTFQSQMLDNISQTKLYGDNPSRSTERARLVHSLNQLAMAQVGKSFTELCGQTSTDRISLDEEQVSQTTQSSPDGGGDIHDEGNREGPLSVIAIGGSTIEIRDIKLNRIELGTLGKWLGLSLLILLTVLVSLLIFFTMNHPPSIKEIVLPSSPPSVGTKAELRVIATDMDDDDLTYYWYAEKGKVPDGPQDDTVTYLAPESGGWDKVIVTVTDGKAQDTETRQLLIRD